MRPLRRLAPPLAALLLLACGGQRGLPADAAATVGDQVVRYGDFEEYLRLQVGEGAGGLESEVLSALFDQFLEERLLVRLAAAEGLVEPGADAAAARQALTARAEPAEPTAEEVERYFREHAEELTRPARLRLRHILVPDAATAQQAHAAIVGGESFAEVARRVSTDPGAAAGGAQGELAIGDLPSPYAEVVAALAPGEVSPVLEGGDGYHLFLVEERRAEEAPSLAEASPIIEERLRRERLDDALGRALDEARDRHPVTVYSQNLPFLYEGTFREDDSHPASSR